MVVEAHGGFTTEIIKAIGAEKAVIGVDKTTKEQNKWPTYVTELSSVGESSTLDIEKIISLKPDLVIQSAIPGDLQAKIETNGVPVMRS